VINTLYGPGPRFVILLTSTTLLSGMLWRTGRQHPSGRPFTGKHSLSSQADPRRHKPRPTLHPKDTPSPGEVRSLCSQTSVQPSTLREPSPARGSEVQHRDRSRQTGRLALAESSSGGKALLTAQTAALAPDVDAVPYESRGRRTLRDVSEPVELVAVIRQGTPPMTGAHSTPLASATARRTAASTTG
jgi:hypothetical protein